MASISGVHSSYWWVLYIPSKHCRYCNYGPGQETYTACATNTKTIPVDANYEELLGLSRRESERHPYENQQHYHHRKQREIQRRAAGNQLKAYLVQHDPTDSKSVKAVAGAAVVKAVLATPVQMAAQLLDQAVLLSVALQTDSTVPTTGATPPASTATTVYNGGQTATAAVLPNYDGSASDTGRPDIIDNDADGRADGGSGDLSEDDSSSGASGLVDHDANSTDAAAAKGSELMVGVITGGSVALFVILIGIAIYMYKHITSPTPAEMLLQHSYRLSTSGEAGGAGGANLLDDPFAYQMSPAAAAGESQLLYSTPAIVHGGGDAGNGENFVMLDAASPSNQQKYMDVQPANARRSFLNRVLRSREEEEEEEGCNWFTHLFP
jgi:hypothetical protein